MTEREDALHYIKHDGKAEWIPGFLDCIEMIFPYEVVRERPTREEGSGYDYFGCWWEFDPVIGGSSPLPGNTRAKTSRNGENRSLSRTRRSWTGLRQKNRRKDLTAKTNCP